MGNNHGLRWLRMSKINIYFYENDDNNNKVSHFPIVASSALIVFSPRALQSLPRLEPMECASIQ